MTDINSTHLKDLILKTIKIYNSYRSPEITAHLVTLNKHRFIIEFEGQSCMSCNIGDYFEDFIYEWQTINKKIKLENRKTTPMGPQTYRVEYYIKNNFLENEEETLFRKFLSETGLSYKEYLTSNSCTKDVIIFHFRTWLFEKKEATQKRV